MNATQALYQLSGKVSRRKLIRVLLRIWFYLVFNKNLFMDFEQFKYCMQFVVQKIVTWLMWRRVYGGFIRD